MFHCIFEIGLRILIKRRLILLEAEHIVTLTTYYLLSDFSLATHGVGCNDAPADVQ